MSLRTKSCSQPETPARTQHGNRHAQSHLSYSPRHHQSGDLGTCYIYARFLPSPPFPLPLSAAARARRAFPVRICFARFRSVILESAVSVQKMPARKTGFIQGPNGWRHVVPRKYASVLKKFFAQMGYPKVVHLEENPYEYKPEEPKDSFGVTDSRFYLCPKVPVVVEAEVSEVIPYYLLPIKNTRRDEKKWARATSIGDKVIVYGSYGDFGLQY